MIGQEENGKWRRGGEGRGVGPPGAQKHSLNDGTWAGEPAHTLPDDPSAPVHSWSTVTSSRCHTAPGCLPLLSFLLHHLLSPGCWYDQRQALRETSLSTDITLCLSHTCLRCLLLISSDASHQPANEQLWQGERETERDEGRGQKGGIRERERPVYFARQTENSPKRWAGITLSNIDSDFLGEKQPALVNLEWLWNNLDWTSHIGECQKRNALQQFIAAAAAAPRKPRTDHPKWQVNLKMSAVQNVNSRTPALRLCLAGSVL